MPCGKTVNGTNFEQPKKKSIQAIPAVRITMITDPATCPIGPPNKHLTAMPVHQAAAEAKRIDAAIYATPRIVRNGGLSLAALLPGDFFGFSPMPRFYPRDVRELQGEPSSSASHLFSAEWNTDCKHAGGA